RIAFSSLRPNQLQHGLVPMTSEPVLPGDPGVVEKCTARPSSVVARHRITFSLYRKVEEAPARRTIPPSPLTRSQSGGCVTCYLRMASCLIRFAVRERCSQPASIMGRAG